LVERGATRSTKTTRQSSSVDQSFQTSDEELELPDDDEEGYGLTEEEVVSSFLSTLTTVLLSRFVAGTRFEEGKTR